MLEGFDPRMIVNVEGAREAIMRLLNIVEGLQQDNTKLREDNQQLRDEINRLKGEKGRPDIKANKKPNPDNYSSEEERHKGKEWKKKGKLDRIQIHETKPLAVDKESLPKDAQFKGYQDVVVQDLKIQAHNTRFRKEKYYSPSEGKTYLADLPVGYEGEFGPGLKSWVLTLYFSCNVSEAKIAELLGEAGVEISAGQISNLLIKGHEGFHAEKEAVYQAGLGSSPWQEIDETGMRVDGGNWHCHVVCNPVYSAYFITEHAGRLTALDVLRSFRERTFLVNEAALDCARVMNVPKKARRLLAQLQGEHFSEEELVQLLKTRLPDLGQQARDSVLAATGIAAYQSETGFPVVRALVSDDAGAFKLLTQEQGLCWVHEGRHYKKMSPSVRYHQELLASFRKEFWSFYERLLEYKKHPTDEKAIALEQEFDRVFSTQTGFYGLDDRIATTKTHKPFLLMVLKYPEIALHTNAAELTARQLVRKRDVSFGVRTQDGRRAWETFLTLTGTAKKLGVSFFKYVHDRISRAYTMPALADVLRERAQELCLGASWAHGP